MEREPAVDRSERDPLQEAMASLSNLPQHYAIENPGKTIKTSCVKLPRLTDLHFNNIYWQVLESSNRTIYSYNAFFDNRTLASPEPSVRILGMINSLPPHSPTYCQLWFDDLSSPVTSQVTEYKYIWVKGWGNHRQGILQPYLLKCQVPEEHRQTVPRAVSLVDAPCDKATNNLRVINNQPPAGEKKDFAVCVKGMSLFYMDQSVRLVEWLELLFLLGADKVFLYDLGVHPNVSKVMNYYQELGRVQVTKLTLPGDQPNLLALISLYLKHKATHKRQNEVIPYNDCLYKNMNLYKFIALLDLDEVIMPKSSASWSTLMKKLSPEVMSGISHTNASYCLRNVYFLDSMQENHSRVQDVPHYMHMLQHVYRAYNYTRPGFYVKCFHDPEVVVTLHNHYHLSCYKNWCHSYSIPTEDAHLQHYRSTCVSELKKNCHKFHNHTQLDNSITRFQEPLVTNTKNILHHLGFL